VNGYKSDASGKKYLAVLTKGVMAATNNGVDEKPDSGNSSITIQT